MQGFVQLNGVSVFVELDIKDGEIILKVPEGTDLKNWYHAVYIKSVVPSNDLELEQIRKAEPDMVETLDELLKYLSFKRPIKSDIQYSFLHPEKFEKAIDMAKQALAKAKGV